jgi:iron complex outermembrane receptor protein
MIEQRAVVSGSDALYFANVTAVNGQGVEAEVEVKLPGGLNGHVSHAYVHTHEAAGTSQLSNSPRHLSKLGLQIPLAAFYLGIDAQYIGERLTLGGTRLNGIFVPNVTLTSPEGRRLELSVSAYNAFATRYADPGAEEHLQQSIPQDGRTLLARVRVRF